MLKINEKGNNINLSKDQKNKGLRLTQRKVESIEKNIIRLSKI